MNRDLIPAYSIWSNGGSLKVGDFGLARDHVSRSLTLDGQTVGTAKYIAAEQAMAKPDIDGRTDLYALGCILFEMIAGRPPFTSDDPYGTASYVQLMRKHVEVPAPDVSDFAVGCPPALAALIRILLAKNPLDRPASAAEVATILADIVQNPQVEPRPVSPPINQPQPSAASQSTEAPQSVPLSLTERLQQTIEPERKINVKALIAMAVIALVGVTVAWVLQSSK